MTRQDAKIFQSGISPKVGMNRFRVEYALEDIQASLSTETLEGLRQEASRLIAQEYGKVQFGEQTLIRLKMEQLIRERYI